METLQSLLERRFDFPPHPALPSASYCVATTPRSGSTLLCLRLWSTGLLGAPWEYFNLRHVRSLIRELGAATESDYLARLMSLRTSPNGVFGYKIFFDQLHVLGQCFAGLLQQIFTPNVIFLRRRDEVRQAISLAVALQTNSWTAGQPHSSEPRYDADHIRACLAHVRWQNAKWCELFERQRIEPLSVWYEDICVDPTTCFTMLGERFDIDVRELAQQRIAMPISERQSGATLVEWLERFEE